jgi:hypothetical protein
MTCGLLNIHMHFILPQGKNEALIGATSTHQADILVAFRYFTSHSTIFLRVQFAIPIVRGSDRVIEYNQYVLPGLIIVSKVRPYRTNKGLECLAISHSYNPILTLA